MIFPGSLLEVIRLVDPPHLARRGTICLITAFLDESGTHGSASGSTVMAGFIGNKNDWAMFEDGWASIMRRHPEVATVHGKQLIPQCGIYHRWKDEKYWRFIVEIAGLIRASGIIGMICAVKIPRTWHIEVDSYPRSCDAILPTDCVLGFA